MQFEHKLATVFIVRHHRWRRLLCVCTAS